MSHKTVMPFPHDMVMVKQTTRRNLSVFTQVWYHPTCMCVHAWQHNTTLNNPITWTKFFRGMEHTYVSCVIYRVPRVEYKYSNTRDSHTWNTYGHTGAINIRCSPPINLQKHIEIQSTTVKATHIVHS